MQVGRAVVIPFGVPSERQGLGLGLAALVHSTALFRGEEVALAQLHSQQQDAPGEEVGQPRPTPQPVEALVLPATWREIGQIENAPREIEVVISGAFEPPIDGRGSIRVMAYDARTSELFVTLEAGVEEREAGRAIGEVFERIWQRVGGGHRGAFEEIAGLEWDALEALLFGERSAIRDPVLGVVRDPIAAIAYFERAVADAPTVALPAKRLSDLVVQVARDCESETRIVSAGRRAVERAMVDSPLSVELIEAHAITSLRLGMPAQALADARRAVASSPDHTRGRLALVQAYRALGDQSSAIESVNEALGRHPNDIHLLFELGAMRAEEAAVQAAIDAWGAVLDRAPGHVGAFIGLAQLGATHKRVDIALKLVDHAILLSASRGASPALLKKALELIVANEADGLARSSRICVLAKALGPSLDVPLGLLFARALHKTGSRAGAIDELRRLESVNRGHVLRGEVQHLRFSLEEPEACAEVEAVYRAASSVDAALLPVIAARAKRLASLYPSWMAHTALGIAERRLGRTEAAKAAFIAAVDIAPKCEAVVAAQSAIKLGRIDGG